MTNEEKARSLNRTIYRGKNSAQQALLKMAEWKDEEYKGALSIPKHLTTMEDIANYFKSNLRTKEWNNSKVYQRTHFKEFLEKKKDEIYHAPDTYLGEHYEVCETLIGLIINEYFEDD